MPLAHMPLEPTTSLSCPTVILGVILLPEMPCKNCTLVFQRCQMGRVPDTAHAVSGNLKLGGNMDV